MSSKTVQLRGKFHSQFCETARARIARSLELVTAGASANAAAIHIELYSLAGEAAFLGYSAIFTLARQGETAARRIPYDPTAAVGCTRALRALGRALDTLEARLPRGEIPPPPAAAAPRPSTRGRILLVDDSKLAADLLAEVLAEEGFAVETANNGPGLERALATFRFDLALSDVNMPDLDCGDVCRRVRGVAPGAPVVLISGLAEEELAGVCRRVGADGYVPRERGLAAIVERVIVELAARAERRR